MKCTIFDCVRVNITRIFMSARNKSNNYCKKIYFIFILSVQCTFFTACKGKKNISFNENGIYGAFFNDKYKKIFAGNGKGQLFVFNDSLKIITIKQFAHGPVATCISSPDNEYMINTSGDGTLYIWKVTYDSVEILYKNKVHNSASMTCLFSPEMNYAVSTGHDSAVVVIDWKHKSVLQKLSSDSGTVRFAWFSYDDKYLFWADDKGFLYKTDTETWKSLKKRISKRSINCIVSNMTNSEILVSSDDNNVYVLEFTSLEIIQVIKAHTGPVYVAEFFNKEQTELATCGYDGCITKWKKINNIYTIENKIEAHNGPCCTLYYNDNGTRLMSGGQDGWLKIWESKNLKLLNSINVNTIH